MRNVVLVALGLVLIPLSAQAFSEGFKKSMTDVQTRVMLRGEKVSPGDLKQWWAKYDEEIIALLSAQKPSEEDLNKQTQAVELNVVESKGTEIEDIELGKIGATFHKLDQAGKAWVVVLNNSMYAGSTPLPYSTVRFYKVIDGKAQRVGALDEMNGQWDKEKIQFSSVQIQPMGKGKSGVKFATYHAWPKSASARPNRSQIVWEFKDEPKAKLIVPEVDWHTGSDGTVVEGRGEAYDVP